VTQLFTNRNTQNSLPCRALNCCSQFLINWNPLIVVLSLTGIEISDLTKITFFLKIISKSVVQVII